MEQRYTKRLAEILASEHRDELIISMMKDLSMFDNQNRFINSVIKDKSFENEIKIKIISKYLSD
jgi:2-phospho-L-lactate guanylyltransferase (CobY/MobA/RfbA family)